MIQTLARIDLHASRGDTPWHRASALSKLLLSSALVLLAVFAPSLKLLLTLHVLAWTLALTSRVPGPLLATAAGYPIGFSLLFLIGRWDGTVATPAMILLRPLTASLCAVWLVGTTPYPDLFAPISRLVPRRAADGLFLTYRALFELLGRLERLWRAMRLRGGTSATARRQLHAAGEGLGTLVLYGFERGQRLWATMLLRGHSDRICGCRHYAEVAPEDGLVAAMGALAVAAAVLLWRAA